MEVCLRFDDVDLRFADVCERFEFVDVIFADVDLIFGFWGFFLPQGTLGKSTRGTR